jgi:hypothetical protein
MNEFVRGLREVMCVRAGEGLFVESSAYSPESAETMPGRRSTGLSRMFFSPLSRVLVVEYKLMVMTEEEKFDSRSSICPVPLHLNPVPSQSQTQNT